MYKTRKVGFQILLPSCLENPMDGGAWKATVHGITKSQTRLSDFTFTKSKALAQSIKQKEMFFWNSCVFDDTADVGNLTSSSSAFSKTSLNIWKVHSSHIAEAWLGEF